MPKQSQTLVSLGKQLMGFIPRSRALSTIKKYNGGWTHWRQFCKTHGLCPLPAKPLEFALYLTHVLNNKKTAGSVSNAITAANFVHRQTHLALPGEHPLPKVVLEVAMRTCKKPLKKATPMTPAIIKRLVNKYGKSTLDNFMILVGIVVGYAAFGRWSDLARVELSASVFEDTHLSLFIAKSKTDQYMDGSFVPIARTGSPTCPVRLLERFLRKSRLTEGTFLRRVLHTKNGYSLRSENMTYTTFLSRLRTLLQGIGFTSTEAKKFSTHSMRVGGATYAAALGVEDRLIQKHGRWMSANIKNGYIREQTSQLLSVTRNLGL